MRLCKALDCGRCGCLKPIRACCVVKSAFFLVAPPRGGFAMAPRDSGMCWKQFMMCLEEVWFVAMIHLRFMPAAIGASRYFFIRQEEDDLAADLFLFHGSRGALNDLSTTRNFEAEKVASKPPLKKPLSEGTFKASKLWRN